MSHENISFNNLQNKPAFIYNVNNLTILFLYKKKFKITKKKNLLLLSYNRDIHQCYIDKNLSVIQKTPFFFIFSGDLIGSSQKLIYINWHQKIKLSKPRVGPNNSIFFRIYINPLFDNSRFKRSMRWLKIFEWREGAQEERGQ